MAPAASSAGSVAVARRTSLREKQEECEQLRQKSQIRNTFALYQFQIVAVSIVVVWLLVGSIYNTHVNEWTTAQGFYFAVQSGFSVGFGASGVTCSEGDSAHPNACRWYAVFNILVGSSLISTAFGMFLSFVVNEADEKKAEWRAEEKNNLLKGNRKTGPKNSKFKRFLEKLVEAGIIRAAKLSLAFMLLISIGVIFGMTHERRDSLPDDKKWDFVQSLLYAVSALSTGGLQSPSIDNAGMWFTGWYCLVGCPVYGLLLATASSVLAAKQADAERKAALSSFSDDDKKSLDDIDARSPNPDGLIQWGEFLELYLVKLGMANRGDLIELRQKFDELDIDGSGALSQSEILAELELARIDAENDRTICLSEFFLLCYNIHDKYPSLFPGLSHIINDEDKIKVQFDKADTDGSGELERKEVLLLLHSFAAHDADPKERRLRLKGNAIKISQI